MAVSIDDAEELPAVKEFLASQGFTGENLISKFGLDTKSNEEFELEGGLPLYKLYDREGELRHQFSLFPDGLENGVHIDELDEKIDQLLAES